MDSNRTVSIVIPCLNAAWALDRCLSEIAHSDYPSSRIELVVIDNGSTDQSVAISKRFTDQIIIDPEANISKLRNLGARSTTGEILVFLDSDCILGKDWLPIAVRYFDDPHIGMVGSTVNNIPENFGWVSRAWNAHLTRKNGIYDVHWLGSRAIAVRREAFEKAGGFDERLATCEDVEFGYALNRYFRILADDRLSPIHLGEPDTLSVFFKKEIWRGKDSIRTSLRHLSKPKELIGVLLPFYCLLSFLLPLTPVIAYAQIPGMRWFAFALFLFLLPVILLSVHSSFRLRKWKLMPQLAVLYSIYLIARMLALLKP
jgi:glycosyltransferase involved in cell wall biosynthesis